MELYRQPLHEMRPNKLYHEVEEGAHQTPPMTRRLHTGFSVSHRASVQLDLEQGVGAAIYQMTREALQS